VASKQGSYDLIMHQGYAIGGIFQPPTPKQSALWIGAMSVSDIKDAEIHAVEQGADIVLPPHNLPDLGTRLLLRDPQGALVALLQTTDGDPADRPVPPGELFWMDLFTSDPAAAAKFYQGLIGYEIHERDIGNQSRLLLASGDYARAGIEPLPEQVERPGWLPYILVNNVADTLKLVPPSGGKILIEPQADLLDGHLAVLADPDGGVLGILEWSEQSGEGPQ
jgi:predicted enzyme related to lactoylglutathione lyase